MAYERARFLSASLRGELPQQCRVAGPGTDARRRSRPRDLSISAEKCRSVSLGKAPLEGCDRVFEGTESALWLIDRASKGIGIKIDGFGGGNVPERIVVRRAGLYLSCSDIAARVISHREETAVNGGVNCGALGRIRKDVSLNTIRKSWDPALQSWDLRCDGPYHGLCSLPGAGSRFGFRQPGRNARDLRRSEVSTRIDRGSTCACRQKIDILVGPGRYPHDIARDLSRLRQEGDTVRVRLESGSRIMQATVTAQGTLVVDR